MKLFKTFLRLFDGEAAGGESTTQPVNTEQAPKGEHVLYGKQKAPDTQEQTDVPSTSNTLDDKRKTFRDLVSGEYKDIYTEETQRIINQRFKETKTLQAEVDKAKPLLDMLYQRYKVSDGDTAGLMSALENDDAYWSEAADEAGLTVEQYKQFQKMERELKAAKALENQRLTQQQANEQLMRWTAEADALKQTFPKFNLEVEASNPEFISLLKAGLPMEHAYKTIHFNELMNDAMATTATNTEKNVVSNIRAKGARPTENGMASQSAFTVKDDVSKLTKKDRAEIARRAMMGDTIYF